MTKKGKRAALLQHTERIAELQRENEELKTRLAGCEKAEAGSRPSHEPSQAFIYSAADAFTICDSHLTVIDVDDTALRYLGPGLRKEDVIGKNLADFTADRERLARYAKVMETGKPYAAEETFVLPRDGEVGVITRAFRVGDRLGILTSEVTRHERAGEELQRRERYFRTLVESSPDGIMVLNRDGTISYENQGCLRLLGHALEERAGRSAFDPIHPDDMQAASHAFEEAASGLPVRVELRARHRDGSWRNIEATRIDLLEDPSLQGIVFNLRDVTERKQAEDALRASEQAAGESEKKFRTLFDGASDAIVIHDLAGHIFEANQVICERLGYTREEMLALTPMDIDSPEYASRVPDRIKQILQEGHAIFETAHRTKDGRVIPIEATSRLMDFEGQPAVLTIARDTTERVKAEQALTASEAKYQNLFDQGLMGMEVVDGATGKIAFANNAMARMFGFKSPADMVGINPLDYVLLEDQEWVARQMAQVIVDPEKHETVTMRLKTQEGQDVWITGAATSLEHEGRPSVLISVIDTTATREAEIKLHESEEKYRLVVDNANQGMVVIQDEVVMFANPKLAELTGYALKEMGSKPFLELIHPDDRQMILGYYIRKIKGEQLPNVYPVRLLDKAGNTKWAETNAVMLNWEGKPAVLALINDLTERKEAEDTLRASEERYRAVVEHANEGMAVLQDGVMKYVNPRLAAMAGCAAEEMLAKSFLEFTHPDDRQMAIDHYVRRQRGEDIPSAYQFRFLRKDGTTGWAEMSATLLEWDGRMASLAMINDITERVKVQQALADSETKYRSFFDQALMGMQVVDGATGKLVLANAAAARMFGFKSPEDMIGLDPLDYVLPEDRGWVVQQWAKVMADPQKREVSTARARTEDGRTIWVTASATSFTYEGKPSSLIWLIDTTTTKEAEIKLHESEEKYRTVVDNATEGIIVIQDGVLKFANRRCAEAWGVGVEEMFGEPFTATVHPDDREAMLDRHLKRVSGEKVSDNYEYRWINKAGDTGWAEMHAVPINWEGKPATLGMMKDITESKKAEEALADSEAKYRDLFDHTLLGMEVVDAQTGRVLLANRSLARMFGFKSPTDMIGIDPTGYVLPEDREWVVRDVAQLMTDPSWDKIATIRSGTADGRIIWLTGLATQFKYEGRTAMLISLVDVTAAKEVEFKLHESEEQHRLLVDNATEAIAVLQEGRIRFGNRKFAQVSGYSPEEFSSAPSFLEFVHPDDRGKVADYYDKRLTGKEVPATYQFRFRDKAGNVGWAEANVTLIPWGGKSATLSQMDIITERKKADESLRASEEKYRLLTEKTTDVIWTTDMNLRTTYLSPSAEKVFGFKPEERLGMEAADQMTPESMARAQRLLLEQLELEQKETGDSQRTLSIELEYYRKDGSTIWMEALVSGIRDATGTLIGLHGISRDLTQRREAQKALRESEHRYRLLAENATDIIWATDAALKVTYVSPSVTRLMGYGIEDIVDSPLGKLITPTSLALITGVHEGSLVRERETTGSMGERSVEVELVRKNGSTLWVEAAVNVIRDAGGQFAGFQGACRDITARREAEETLRASEERNRVVVENTNEAIAVLQDGVIKFGNRKFTTVTGYAVEEFVLKPFLEIVYPDDRQMIADFSAKRRAGEEAPTTYEFRFLNRAGAVGWAEANVALIDWEGRIGTLLSMNIITEGKLTEKALRASEERFRTIFEKSPIGAIVYDSAGVPSDVNEACVEIFGTTREAALKTPSLFDDPSLPDEAKERLRAGRSIDGEAPLDLNHAGERSLYSTGESGTIHVRLIVTPLGGEEEGSTRGYLGLVEDITERKRMEDQILKAHAELEARVEQRTAELKDANELLIQEIRQRQQAQKKLQESESKYRELVENANSIILELDTRGRVTFFNRFAQEFYGFKESEIVGRHVVGTITPPTDSTGKDMKSETKDIVKHPEDHFVTENEGIRQNGERVWISWTNKGLHDAEGRLRNVLCIGMDRTEQRRVSDMLAEQVKEKAAADERQRLARDLHDAVTQTLFSASLIAEVLPRLWRKDRAEAVRRLEELRRLTRGSLAEMRMLLLELRPGALGEVGLVELLRQLIEAARAQTRLQLALSLRGKCSVPANVQVALYRVAQEALNNVVRHSGATEAEIRLNCREGAADLTVSDNGSGFDLKKVSPRSLGLRIMHERVEAVGATLKIERRADGGTRVRALWSRAKRKGDS